MQIQPIGTDDLHFVLRNNIYNAFQTRLFTGAVKKICGGAYHAFIQTDTKIYSHGSNSDCQLASNKKKHESYREATLLENLPVKKLYSGGWHCYALLDDGTFYGWGHNFVSLSITS
jgi:alpha-tubulin suppressor-like RCC1 family protein